MKIFILLGLLVIAFSFCISPVEVFAIPSDQNIVVIKSWALPLPDNQSSGFALTSSFSGNEIYFADSNANTIGRLIPFSSEITEWKLQEKPSYIEIDSAGSVHYIDENGTKIVRLD